MSSSARIILPVSALVVAVLIAFGLSQCSPKASGGKRSSSPVLSVEVLPIQPQTFSVQIDSFGVLQAKTQTSLFPLVSGQVSRVTSVFENGAFFKRGDVLLEIDPTDYAIEVQVAEGNVAQAELNLAEEKARHEQAERDWKKQKQGQTATDLALRVPQLNAARASLETAKAQLKLAKLNLNRTVIKAPYDGRVLDVATDVGSLVSPSTRIGDVYSTATLEVRLPIANKHLPFLNMPRYQDGLEENAAAASEVILTSSLFGAVETWQAKGIRTEASIDASSQQLYLVALIEKPFDEAVRGNRHELKIGQYVSAAITGKTLNSAIVIPNSAIYQGSYVYTVKDELLQRADIDVLWRDENISVVKQGLKEGDALVTTLLGQVISGTKVKVINGQPNPEGDQP